MSSWTWWVIPRSRVTMDLYSHVAPVLQREAADRMDALLDSVSTK